MCFLLGTKYQPRTTTTELPVSRSLIEPSQWLSGTSDKRLPKKHSCTGDRYLGRICAQPTLPCPAGQATDGRPELSGPTHQGAYTLYSAFDAAIGVNATYVNIAQTRRGTTPHVHGTSFQDRADFLRVVYVTLLRTALPFWG